MSKLKHKRTPTSLVQKSPFFQSKRKDYFFQPLISQNTVSNKAQTIQKQEAQPTQQPTAQTLTCQGREITAEERTQRLAIMNDMLRDYPAILSIEHRERLFSSLCAFSLNQLNQMREAGVRFWVMPRGYPPQLSGLPLPDGASEGTSNYTKHLRMIRLPSVIRSSIIIHELAHAWDHVRNMRQRRRLDDLNRRQRIRAVRNPSPLTSETNQTQEFSMDGGNVNLAFTEMFNRYIQRMRGRPRDLYFHAGARDGYSGTSVREFYAEGYAVFHGNWIIQQGIMYRFAPELYFFLQQEAQTEGLPIPDISAVRAEASQYNR